MTSQKNEQNDLIFMEVLNQLCNNTCDPNDFDFYMNLCFDEIIQYIKTDILQQNLIILQEQEMGIKRFAHKLDIFEQDQLKAAYQLGVLKSIISLMQKYQAEITKSSADLYVEKLEQNQQLCKMIIILYNKNSIRHQDLADALNISKSALSNMIKKTQDLELYSTKRHGKFKYYYSNFRTKEVYKKYRDKNINQRYTQAELDNIISTIFVILFKEIKENKKINYSNIIKHLPYRFSMPQKSVVSSIENFVREYNYNISNDYLDANKFWISNRKTYDESYKNITILCVQEDNSNL